MISGGGGATEVVVYVVDVRQNAFNELRTVPRSQIWEMKFLDQNRAVIMHGPGHEMGCIEVTTVYKRCGCQLAREPCVCKHATMPTARSRTPVSVRIAAVTVRAATRAISPSRRRR